MDVLGLTASDGPKFWDGSTSDVWWSHLTISAGCQPATSFIVVLNIQPDCCYDSVPPTTPNVVGGTESCLSFFPTLVAECYATPVIFLLAAATCYSTSTFSKLKQDSSDIHQLIRGNADHRVIPGMEKSNYQIVNQLIIEICATVWLRAVHQPKSLSIVNFVRK